MDQSLSLTGKCLAWQSDRCIVLCKLFATRSALPYVTHFSKKLGSVYAPHLSLIAFQRSTNSQACNLQEITFNGHGLQ